MTEVELDWLKGSSENTVSVHWIAGPQDCWGIVARVGESKQIALLSITRRGARLLSGSQFEALMETSDRAHQFPLLLKDSYYDLDNEETLTMPKSAEVIVRAQDVRSTLTYDEIKRINDDLLNSRISHEQSKTITTHLAPYLAADISH